MMLIRNLKVHVIYQGRPQDLGGGGRIFFQICEFACCEARGLGGMLPREFFLKRCTLLRFRVYFDQILSKMTIFYIKKNIL